MPTAIEPAPTRDASVRVPLGAKVSAISIVLASIATLVIVFGMLQAADDEPVQIQASSAQASSAQASPTQASPPQPTTAPPRAAAPVKPSTAPPQPEPSALAMDEYGFVEAARCDTSQQAVAIARTARSAMVICRDTTGTYEYIGTRLSDGASLRLDDVLPIPAGFEARNDGTTYRLSATELVVLTGEDLLRRDAIVEYRAG